MDILQKEDIMPRQAMTPVMVRIPPELKQKALEIVSKKREKGERITETDIYRTAIVIFLSGDFTDSKVIEKELAS